MIASRRAIFAQASRGLHTFATVTRYVVSMASRIALLTSLSLVCIAQLTLADVVSLTPVADATIHAASNGIDEAANGAGPWNFAGSTTRFGERRALLRFDIAGNLPVNATITSATLTIHVDRGIDDNNGFRVHRVTSGWNEGLSLPEEPGGEGTQPLTGDVTWSFRGYHETPSLALPWLTPGGDFAATASSHALLSRNGAFTFASSPQMLADVAAWLDAPAANHGWIILVDEPMLSGTAKRFASREAADLTTRPTLTITFTTCGDLDFNNDGVFPDDRDVAAYFGVLAGEDCLTCDSIDFNGDGVFPDDRDAVAFLEVLAGGTCD